jgi:hypothetical protein
MSEPIYQILTPGFSTADAEMPKFSFYRDNVTLEFVDWQNQVVKIIFSNVIRLHWNENTNLESAEIRDDSVYEVKNSPWIADYNKVYSVDSSYRHYKLCFNNSGVFDIACVGFEKSTS